MANLSQTAASVVPSTNAKIERRFNFGEAGIVAGNSVYLDTTANTWKLAQKDGTAAEAGGTLPENTGVALNGGGTGQPAAVQVGGDINLGATLILGETYIVSATAGAIAPIGDVSTHYVTVLGVAITTAILRMPPGGPLASGVQRAA